MDAHVSLLGYALLGLLHQRPGSGYVLRKIFATTPMGTFSDSPGAIYPALRRLERQGLVRGRVEQSAGLRQKQTFRLTPGGKAALEEWLERPLTRDGRGPRHGRRHAPVRLHGRGDRPRRLDPAPAETSLASWEPTFRPCARI